LRDVKDTSVSTLSTQIHSKLNSLKSLLSHLKEMATYLDNVCSGRLPLNHQILNQFQDMFNLAPNLNVEELARSFTTKTNDMMLVIYLCSLVRSIIALHTLINNKLDNRDAEKALEQRAMAESAPSETAKA
jgi:26S proteasome regulatory subunit N8